jgi:hypothetical protein
MNGNDARNTIATSGDIHYLWGIFMLVASARKAGMAEPFLVGTKDFNARAERVLGQLGGVEFVPLDGDARSMTCLKAKVLLRVRTEFVTWADSDGFFTGNVSSILPPENPGEIHFRLRTPPEMPAAFKGHTFGEDGKRIPHAVLEAWRRDLAAVAGEARTEPRYETAGSAAFFSLSAARHRRFLEIWDALQTAVLPARDVGVVDTLLEYYHQLDESTLNACLNFVPDAPLVQKRFLMDKDRSRLYMHFVSRPKPWVGWTKRAFRFFDEYVGVLDWAVAQGLELPGSVPGSLKAANKPLCRLLVPWTTLQPKLARRWRRVFG